MILVHHLRVGRSVFTVWLLEEMGLDYELKIYVRNEMGRAPPELREAHPLGKSPVIVDDGLMVAETGAIASYLVDRYDTENRFAPPREDVAARAEWTTWLHYPEGSAFMPLLMTMLLGREKEPKPPILSAFTAGEVKLHLSYMENALGDKDFLLGDAFSAVDVGFSYIASMAERLGLLKAYPKLDAYRERNMKRPAFLRAVEKTGG